MKERERKRLIPAAERGEEAKPASSSQASRSLEPPAAPSIHEHHGLAAVEDDAILEMIAHRARQHAAFDVAALADEIFRRVAMADALDVLVDDRAFVEVAR